MNWSPIRPADDVNSFEAPAPSNAPMPEVQRSARLHWGYGRFEGGGAGDDFKEDGTCTKPEAHHFWMIWQVPNQLERRFRPTAGLESTLAMVESKGTCNLQRDKL